jgi:hypothetical protein
MDMSMVKVLGSAVLASTVLLVGCGDDKQAVDEKQSAPAAEQSTAEPSAMDTLKQETGEAVEAAGEVMKEAEQDVRDTADQMTDKAAEMGEQIKQDAADAYQQAEESVSELGDKAADTAAELEQDARAKLDSMQQDTQHNAESETQQ